MTQAYIREQNELRQKRNAILGEEYYTNDAQTGTAITTKTKKEKLTQTAKGLGNDLLLGVIGGGLAGALLGRYSFIVGLGIAGYGHYSENKLMGTIGLGMMASGTAHALLGGKEQNPKASLMENVSERVEGFKNELKRKVWIDKWNTKDGLNGLFKKPTEQNQNNTNANQKSNASATTTEQLNGNNNSATTTVDYTKPIEPIDPSGFEELSKEEEIELNKQLENAGISSLNQFFAKRHHLNLSAKNLPSISTTTEKNNNESNNENKNTTLKNETNAPKNQTQSATTLTKIIDNKTKDAEIDAKIKKEMDEFKKMEKVF